jgi:hypothetical protein
MTCVPFGETKIDVDVNDVVCIFTTSVPTASGMNPANYKMEAVSSGVVGEKIVYIRFFSTGELHLTSEGKTLTVNVFDKAKEEMKYKLQADILRLTKYTEELEKNNTQLANDLEDLKKKFLNVTKELNEANRIIKENLTVYSSIQVNRDDLLWLVQERDRKNRPSLWRRLFYWVGVFTAGSLCFRYYRRYTESKELEQKPA